MDERLQKLKALINEIEPLKTEEAWGGKYKDWNFRVEQLLSNEFGTDALSLFKGEINIVCNQEGYISELEQRNTLLNQFIINEKHYKPKEINTQLSQIKNISLKPEIIISMLILIAALIAIPWWPYWWSYLKLHL